MPYTPRLGQCFKLPVFLKLTHTDPVAAGGPVVQEVWAFLEAHNVSVFGCGVCARTVHGNLGNTHAHSARNDRRVVLRFAQHFFFCLLLSSLELSDKKVYEP